MKAGIKYYLIGFTLCFCHLILPAQQNKMVSISSKNAAEIYSETAKEARQKYLAKEYETSAMLYEKAIASGKGVHLENYYNAACSWALAGNKLKAFENLDSAVIYAAAETNIEYLKTDKDLQNLKNEKQWNVVIEKFKVHNAAVRLRMEERTPTYYWGMYLGILFILFFYNLFLFFSTKDISFLYYSLSIFFLSQLHTIITGSFGFYSKELFFWFKYIKWDNNLSFFTASLMVIFHLLFVRSFLNLKEIAPRINKGNNVLILYLIILGIITVFINGLGILFFLSLLTAYLFSFAVGIYSWKAGNKSAKFLVIAGVFLTTGVSLALLNGIGIINVNFRLSVFRTDNIGFIAFYGLLSFALGDKINILKQEKLETQAKALEVLEVKVKERTAEIAGQKTIIEKKNKDITDSIDYAKTIQEATLPSTEDIHKYFPDSFILFKPKDIVSGDFYWFAEKNGRKLIAACDCTGHGVPGALMSMIGNNILNQIVNEKEITAPDEILNNLHKEIRKTLKQEEQSETKDGMDAAIITFNNETEIEYSGAQRPVWIVKPEAAPGLPPDGLRLGGVSLAEIKGNKFAIGGLQAETERKFTNHTISLSKGDCVYIFSDGFADQFSESDKKLMTYKFKEILCGIQEKTMQEQKKYLDTFVDTWRGNREQIDDILVIGVRL